jgi:glutamyl/glutaminyl-tRNA synthetase
MSIARTRFAPSPTGFLHVGGVRTALFNYLLAKKTGGKFILRLEDTDRERFVARSVQQIVESLNWLGLRPDEGFWISEGQHQNVEYIQSERHKRGFYQRYADELVKRGLAYYSPTLPEKLNELRDQAKAEKRAFLYGRHLDPDNSDQPIKDTPIRLDISAFFKSLSRESNYKYLKPFPRPEQLVSHELWQTIWQEPTGREVQWTSHLIDDFIIIKSDGFPTYNFANVIDDHDMGITHVLRGGEFVASTPKHIILYEALGIAAPTFVHLPVINGADGKKLSKRTGDTDTLDYRDRGYLPEALINFLALLGWNDGTEQEIYELDELIEKFQPEDINSSPAVFDQRRLDWMNGYWIREKLELDDLYERSQTFWPDEAGKYDDKYKKQVLAVVRERLKYFAELPELTKFFFVDLPVNKSLIENHKQLKKLSTEELRDLLERAKLSLEKSDFTVDDLTMRLNNLLDETGQKPAVLFSLIRIATTQAPASPGLADTLAILGKDRSLARIDQQLANL